MGLSTAEEKEYKILKGLMKEAQSTGKKVDKETNIKYLALKKKKDGGLGDAKQKVANGGGPKEVKKTGEKSAIKKEPKP